MTRVSFYRTGTDTLIEYVDTDIIPRKGEIVDLDDTYRVVDVTYRYPRPGSMYYVQGKGPAVDVLCAPSTGMWQP